VARLERDEKVRKCVLGMCLKIQILVCFAARIDVCIVRKGENGFVAASLGVVAVCCMGEQFNIAEARGGGVGVCVWDVSENSNFGVLFSKNRRA